MEKGDGVFIEKHARALASGNKVSVLMVKADPSEKKKYHIDTDIECDGNMYVYRVYVPKVKFELPLITGILRFFYFVRGSMAGYKQVINNCGYPDISHVNVLTRSGLLPYLLRKRYNIPYIITEHWSRYGRGEYPGGCVHKMLTNRIVKHAHCVSPVSANLRDSMIEKGLINNNYHIVNNVVDTDVFYPQKNDDNSKSHFVFSHVSWMRDNAKNISGIINVVDKLRKIRSDFHLKLIGEGVDKAMLTEMVKERGLDGFITFAGAKSGESLASELRNSDALLLFSNFENQPVCVLEALSCGLPVISTDVGAIRDMLADGRGVVIPKGDEEALLSTMQNMMIEYKYYDPCKLHSYIERNYSPQAVAAAYVSLYKKALSGE